MHRTVNQGIRIGLLGLMLAGSLPLHAASNADEYVAEARQYLSKGKPKEAVIQLKNALKNDPSNVAARLLLGELYLRSGDADGAQKELSRASRLGAPKQDWMVPLGQALMMQNDFNGVLNTVAPDDSMPAQAHATALAIRGNAYLGLRDDASAVEAFDASLALQSSNPLARVGKARILVNERKFDEAVEQFSAVLEDYPEHVETRLSRGELYRSLGKLDEAIGDFDVVIKKAAHNPRGYIGRALAYVAKREFDKAEPDVNQLLKRVGDVPIAHYIRGLIAFQKQQFDKAADEMQLVLRSAPDNLQAQMLYGVISYARGEYTIAEDYLTRVVANLPGNAEMRKVLAASRLKLKQADRAIEALTPIVESGQTDDVQALALLGTAHMMRGDSDKGADYMAKAVELAPDMALLRTQLAAGRIALGDSEGAISELESAVDLGQDLIQADVLLVLSYLNEKQYDKAIEVASALEKRMPDSPIPSNLTGLAYLAQSKLDLAEQKFNEALKIQPTFSVARMNLARMGVLAKKPDEARKHYLKVFETDNKHTGAMLGLAALAASQGDDAQTEEWLTKANRADPKDPRPMLLLAEMSLKRNEPLKATNLLAGLSPEQAGKPQALRLKGMALLQAGEFSSAKAEFQRLVDLEPKLVEGWFQLGRAQASSGDNEAASRSFEKAIALDVKHELPLLWVGKGELLLREKRYEDALAHAIKMQEYFPDNAMSYEIEAAAHRGLGDINLAIKAVEKAVRAEGSSKRVNLFAHTLAASGNTPKAVYMLQDWLERNPKDGVSWTTLGMMHQQMGRNDEAVSAYEKALEFTGGNPVVLNNLAWLYLDKDPKKAVSLSRQAYEIAPERAEIVDTYGWVLFQQGKHKEALNVLQQALVIAPRNAEIGLHVADALRHLGRDKEARPLLERIVEEHPHTQFAGPAKDMLKQLKN